MDIKPAPNVSQKASANASGDNERKGDLAKAQKLKLLPAVAQTSDIKDKHNAKNNAV